MLIHPSDQSAISGPVTWCVAFEFLCEEPMGAELAASLERFEDSIWAATEKNPEDCKRARAGETDWAAEN